MNNETTEPIKAGDWAMLSENNWAGDRVRVKVLKVFKGGNALVQDGDAKLEVSLGNLEVETKTS
jgi:hypothetical protein